MGGGLTMAYRDLCLARAPCAAFLAVHTAFFIAPTVGLEWTVTTMPKRINQRRRPATQADVQRAKDTATADACRVTLAIFFTALLDKEGMDAEQLQRIWREVEALSESVRDGYVSAPDLIRVLRDEYEIDIVGG